MGTGELLLWGVTCDGLASHPGGVEILLAASCYGNRDKLRPDEPVWLQGFTLYFYLFYSFIVYKQLCMCHPHSHNLDITWTSPCLCTYIQFHIPKKKLPVPWKKVSFVFPCISVFPSALS